ncbi:MAG: RNA polymerase sigma factor [Bacteroidia bacterium]
MSLSSQEERAFVSLIETNQGIIHKVCRLYAFGLAEREDLFQEIVLQLWRNHKTFSGKSKISTWMYRVALNTAISALRKKERRPKLESNEPLPFGLAERIHDPDIAEKRSFLYRAIDQLSEIERAIILLYLEEQSYEEISQIMGITSNNVGVKLNRIKEKLKKKIVPHFE